VMNENDTFLNPLALPLLYSAHKTKIEGKLSLIESHPKMRIV